MIAAAVVAVLALASVSQAAGACIETLPELEASQFACGLSAASESSNDSSPTLYCSTASAEIRNNRQVNPGGATKPCYFLLRPDAVNGIVLDLPPSLMASAGYAAATRVQLHKSVSVLVGSDKFLVLKGQAIASVNPEIFSDIGDTQKRRLKALALVDTSVESLDASLLRSLNISVLVLAHNAKLTQFTNFQDVRLPALKELHLWKYNTELMDCRSFKSLPSSITKMFVFPSSTDTLGNEAAGCAFCSLPPRVSDVVVSNGVEVLPQYPSATSLPCPPPPYPLNQGGRMPYTFIKSISMCRSFKVSASSATGCDSCSSCRQWTTAAPTTTTAPTTPKKPKEVSGGEGIAEGGGTGGKDPQTEQSNSARTASPLLSALAAGAAVVWLLAGGA